MNKQHSHRDLTPDEVKRSACYCRGEALSASNDVHWREDVPGVIHRRIGMEAVSASLPVSVQGDLVKRWGQWFFSELDACSGGDGESG